MKSFASAITTSLIEAQKCVFFCCFSSLALSGSHKIAPKCRKSACESAKLIIDYDLIVLTYVCLRTALKPNNNIIHPPFTDVAMGHYFVCACQFMYRLRSKTKPSSVHIPKKCMLFCLISAFSKRLSIPKPKHSTPLPSNKKYYRKNYRNRQKLVHRVYTPIFCLKKYTKNNWGTDGICVSYYCR